MIPLSKILELRKKRSAAVACDAADDEICTAEDPSKCRVHGIRRYEREGDYLDKLSHASEESEEARKKFNYFRDLANSMTMEEAEGELSSVFSVMASSKDELIGKEKQLTAKQKILLSEVVLQCEEVDASTIIQTKKCLAATIRHLREKHGVSLPDSIPLLIMKDKDPTRLGAVFAKSQSLEDCCFVFSCSQQKRNDATYCHGDYRDNFDYARHEFWHLLDLKNGNQDGDFYNSLVDSVGKEKADSILKSVSDYAYAKRMEGEACAECFSMMTANEYDGELGNAVENLIHNSFKEV